VSIVFRIVDADEHVVSHKWHMGFASALDAIYPRHVETFGQLIRDRCVWCAVDAEGEYQAMAYAAKDGGRWEIGGLMVSTAMRGKGLGSVMMRLPLAGMLFYENPFSSKTASPQIVAHALKGNEAPRKIFAEMQFIFERSIEVSKERLPGLKADPDGKVRGDEFHLKIPEGLLSLADWCEAWNGRLSDGSLASIDLLEGHTLSVWALAFRDMASQWANIPPTSAYKDPGSSPVLHPSRNLIWRLIGFIRGVLKK
jgi:hypothetical protein